MTRRKRAIALGLCVALAGLWAAAPARAADKKRVIKFASLAPGGSTWMIGLHGWDKEVQEKTDGGLAFRFYEGGVAGDEKDVVRKMKIGQQHGGAFTGVGLGEFFQDVRILDAPHLFNDYAERDYVIEKLYPWFEERFEKNGAVLLGWGEVGYIYIYSNLPITSRADLGKLKVWGWDADPLSLAYMENGGVTPIPLPIPDVLTSLQTGLIDTVYASPVAMIALQWFTKVKYVSTVPFTIAHGGNLMTKKAFDKLSPEQQKILRETGREQGRKLITQLRKDNEAGEKTLEKSGITAVPPTPEGDKELRQISEVTREKLIGKLYSREVYDKVSALLAEFRAGQAAPAEATKEAKAPAATPTAKP